MCGRKTVAGDFQLQTIGLVGVYVEILVILAKWQDVPLLFGGRVLFVKHLL